MKPENCQKCPLDVSPEDCVEASWLPRQDPDEEDLRTFYSVPGPECPYVLLAKKSNLLAARDAKLRGLLTEAVELKYAKRGR
jgi:hypothetical protein